MNQCEQDKFLQTIQNKYVTIFLMNGHKLQGKIIAYDTFSVIVEYDCKNQLIYKHAISTITEAETVD